ncbi:MAG: hypothetical protein WC924_05935 [Candidatus Gracilibacteria bacterium]
MKKETKKHLLRTGLRGVGVGIILAGALALTYVLYQNNVENQVFTNNYTTSVLFSDSLATASGAAPWALLSLNWFVCRSMVKRWLRFIKKRFE